MYVARFKDVVRGQGDFERIFYLGERVVEEDNFDAKI